MTVATLRDKLKDERVEMRRAAVLACAMKEEKKFIRARAERRHVCPNPGVSARASSRSQTVRRWLTVRAGYRDDAFAEY